MYKLPDMAIWQGRVDADSTRWYQHVHAWDGSQDLQQATTLMGFACDEGVRRNQGRTGAREGPNHIRSALANLAYQNNSSVFDAGDVICADQLLEDAQRLAANNIVNVLQHNGNPIILGGGHEVAWASFMGLRQYLDDNNSQSKLGIINFDAHFDLRNPDPQANSGTPFRQIAEYCEQHEQEFNYQVFGINPSVNSQALFDYAGSKKVDYYFDSTCVTNNIDQLNMVLQDFLKKVDNLYVSICLDVFPSHVAPGVSAPAVVGVEPKLVIMLLQLIRKLCAQNNIRWQLTDIAEMNPTYDINDQTAKLAARLVYEISSGR